MMQGRHQLGGESSSSSAAATLLIRHLPEAIPHSTMNALFAHYGASSVRPCGHERMKNCAFVDFKDEIMALQAQKQLHGLRFLGKVLCVERAVKGVGDTRNQEGEKQIRSTTQKNTSVSKDPSDKSREGFNFHGEPIAEKLGIDYPFPPHLENAYPPPDGNILTNIMNALIAVPRFYTQVLHLMNKMNIPAPFRKALPSPPLPLQPVPPPLSSGTNIAENPTTSESEMESSDEERKGENRRKRARRQAIVGPAIDQGVAHEAVGLKPATLVPKEKAIIKKKNPVLKINLAHKQIQSKEEQEVAVEEKSREISPNEPSDHPYATSEELKRGRLPPEEILSLPRFKNYSAGDPSPVLYIKNLAKDVVVDDLYFIFGSFFESLDAAKSNLGVKLMQEGRMRGQAFVTFPTVELARTALNEANGYVFKGKPIVIQFGRSSSATGR